MNCPICNIPCQINIEEVRPSYSCSYHFHHSSEGDELYFMFDFHDDKIIFGKDGTEDTNEYYIGFGDLRYSDENLVFIPPFKIEEWQSILEKAKKLRVFI